MFNQIIMASPDLKDRDRYYTLDVWRGVACLMVVVFHAAFYGTPGTDRLTRTLYKLIELGWLGVPIFFVISGYCITAACESIRRNPKPVSVYFYRRIRRIAPPYWAIVFGSIVLTGILAAAGHTNLFADETYRIDPPWTLSPSQWVGNLTLTEMWRPHLPGQTSAVCLFLGHAWSLCYEEQFYAVCGLVLLLAPRRFYAVMAALTATVLAILLAQFKFGTLPIDGFFFDGHWLLFAAGVSVYHAVNNASALQRRMIQGALLLGLLASLCFARRFGSTLRTELVVAAFFGLLFIALYRWDQAMITSPLLRPVALCGTMCYSLYLVHWPITKVISHALFLAGIRGAWPTLLVSVPACTVASIVVAWAFHVGIERRFLNSLPTLPPVRTKQPAETIRLRFPGEIRSKAA